MFLLLFLCGCSNDLDLEQPSKNENKPLQYEYTLREVTYSEENARYSFLAEMDFTETTYALYYFDPSVDNDERQVCIETTDKILSRLNNLASLPEIYVFTDSRYNNRNIIDNKLFLSVQNWKSIEYATDVLLTAYGEFSHYGLAYGYANLICKDYHLVNPRDSAFVRPSVSALFDLNLLCFDSAFTSESDVKAVESLACNFVETYVATNGEAALQQLLSASNTTDGQKNVNYNLSCYYQDNGIDYSPTIVRYGYGGVSFDYIVSSDFATFYITSDWIDVNRKYNPLIYDNFLHENYADTKSFFEINLLQMDQYQKLFAMSDYRNDLSVVFSNSTSASQYSFYQSETHMIYVKNVDSLMHEYIHSLTQPEITMNSWEIEGFARYFSYKYDYYGIAYLNNDYNNVPDSEATRYIQEYLATLDRPIDMKVDFGELENIAVWSRSYMNPNSSYVAGSSFLQYLVSQFGEETVIDSIYGDKKPLPKSYEELITDWNVYISNTYQSYSKFRG